MNNEASDLIERLKQRTFPEHGGPETIMHGWNLTHGDSELHKACIDEIQKLIDVLNECKHIVELHRTWNGKGWTYHPPYMKKLYELVDLL